MITNMDMESNGLETGRAGLHNPSIWIVRHHRAGPKAPAFLVFKWPLVWATTDEEVICPLSLSPMVPNVNSIKR